VSEQMYFEELSIEEKVIATINYIKNKKGASIRGQKQADQYRFDNSCKIKKHLKGEKKSSMR